MTMSQRAGPDTLPAIAPGPGSYHQTATVNEERELEKLSRQVVALVKQRQQASAPSVGARRAGKGRAGLQGIAEHPAT